MWLLPVFSDLCRLASRAFYRLSVDGPAIPPEGPVLIVANHPNSLVDAVVVSGMAGRRVRFLAKAPLFADPKLGWLVRAAGAIPVYRRQDNVSAVDRNLDAFGAVIAELAKGAAIGIFPEGISHSEPSLVQLRTGTARMAIGTYEETGRTFPIIPVGLVPERKERFRSAMRVVLGEPVAWDDLAEEGRENREAVRELTKRIDRGLRRVTLNLEAWEDRPLVETAEAIWSQRMGEAEGSAEQILRYEVTARILAAVRRGSDGRWSALQRSLIGHRRRLAVLGLRPRDLRSGAGPKAVMVRWRRLYLSSIPAAALAGAGHVAFWVPFQLTRALTAKAAPALDRLSTYKLLIGILAYGAWVVAIALVALWLWGRWVALASLVLLPPLGMAGLWIREWWREVARDIGRVLVLRNRQQVVEELGVEQRRLGTELQALYEAWDSGRVR